MSARTPLRTSAAADDGRARLVALRSRLAALEALPAGPADGETRAWLLPFAGDARLAALGSALPWGGLPRRSLHEVSADRAGAAAATGFCAALLGALAAHAAAPILWITRDATLYAPGLAALGLDPAWLAVARARRDRDALWAMEEGLRTPALAAVLCEVDAVSLLASRRLQLAAEASGVTALLLRCAGEQEKTPPQSAAVTRWRVAPAPGADPGAAPAAARWQVTLLRCRGGRPGQWTIDHPLTSRRHAAPTDRLPLPARLRNRPARARPAAG